MWRIHQFGRHILKYGKQNLVPSSIQVVTSLVGSLKITSERECAICLEMLPAGATPEKVIPLPCGHSFHSTCACLGFLILSFDASKNASKIRIAGIMCFYMMLITSILYLPCKVVPRGMCIVSDILWLKKNSVRHCWLIEAV